MKSAIIQRMLARNRYYIKHLEDNIFFYKEAKKVHDSLCNIREEFKCHDMLKSFRKELSNMVIEQKALKQLAKGCDVIFVPVSNGN